MPQEQKRWQQTTPFYRVQPTLKDPTTWPILSALSGLIEGRQGGANWVPVVSPALKGPLDLNQAIGQGMFDVGKNVFQGLTTNPNARAGPAAPLAPAIAPPSPISFSQVPQVAQVVATPNAPGGSGMGSQIEAFLASTFPGSQVTSGYRAPEKNAKVGGVSNSMHLDDMARDFVLPDMSQADAAVAALKKTGMFTEVLNEGNHIHVGWRPKGVRSAAPNISAQDILAGGMPMQYIDPATAMSMVPNPRMVGQINLPDAPQRELPSALPDLEQANKDAVLAQLASVIQPKEPNDKFDKWDRIAALLQGAATAGASADPGAGLGQFLLRAGAGAMGGFRAESKEQKAEREAYDEKVRQAQVMLAKMGIDIDLSNLGVRNQNKDRQYKSGEDVKDVKYGNANSIFQSQVQEMMANLGITERNVGAVNAANMARANVGLGAMGNQVEAQNRANASVLAGQTQAAQTQDKAIETMLTRYGIDARNDKAPYTVTARGTAAAVLAGNVDGALQNFALELVANGAANSILAPSKGEAPEVARMKREALMAAGDKKKGGPAVAAQMIAQLMAQNPAVALKIAQDFKTTSPSARIILGENKAKTN